MDGFTSLFGLGIDPDMIPYLPNGVFLGRAGSMPGGNLKVGGIEEIGELIPTEPTVQHRIIAGLDGDLEPFREGKRIVLIGKFLVPCLRYGGTWRARMIHEGKRRVKGRLAAAEKLVDRQIDARLSLIIEVKTDHRIAILLSNVL
jgi:hypothetical protein